MTKVLQVSYTKCLTYLEATEVSLKAMIEDILVAFPKLTPDHIIAFRISEKLNQWIMQEGGEFALGFVLGIDRCAEMSQIIMAALPEAREMIERNKDKLSPNKEKEINGRV